MQIVKGLTLLFLISVLTFGCTKKDQPKSGLCDHPTCTKYYEIWKDLLIEKNKLSDVYFDNYIQPHNYEIIRNENGELFTINYTVNIDWAVIELNDRFMISVSNNENVYPGSFVRRGEYFTKDEIEANIGYETFESSLNEIAAVTKLGFNSASEAIDELRKRARTQELFFNKLDYKKSTVGFRANGHPYMFSRGNVNSSARTRLMGEIDLVDKTSSTYTEPIKDKSYNNSPNPLPSETPKPHPEILRVGS